MKLHLFETCPYCVKLRAFIGLKNIPIEFSFLDLGSVPQYLKDSLDNFAVPILEKEDGELLQESNDIIEYLDQLSDQPLLSDYKLSEAVEVCFDRVKFEMDALCYPRLLCVDIPELASDQAKQLFISSRETYLGMSLDQALKNTPDYLPVIHEMLGEVARIIQSEKILNGQREVDMNDFYVFAQLRNLLLVDELSMPASLEKYMQAISKMTQVGLLEKEDI